VNLGSEMADKDLCQIKVTLNIPNYLRYLLLNGAPNRALISDVGQVACKHFPKNFQARL